MKYPQLEPTLTEKQKAYKAILKALPFRVSNKVVMVNCKSVDEIAAKCKGFSANGLASRMHELDKMGFVTGNVRPGKRYKEWHITHLGRKALTTFKAK